jgi:hypothetical protein
VQYALHWVSELSNLHAQLSSQGMFLKIAGPMLYRHFSYSAMLQWALDQHFWDYSHQTDMRQYI